MRRRALAMLVLAALLLTGCWSRVEINDLAIVSMVGLEKTETGAIQVSVHVVIPGQASGSQGGDGGRGGQGGGHSFITVRATGRTIMEAARSLQTELPRRIFWAHSRVILIGPNLAREGVRTVLDFLTRHRELRLTNYLLVVRDDLEEIMATETDLEKLPSEYIREISRSHIGTAVTVGDFAESLAAKGAEPVLGIVTITPPPPGARRDQRPGLKVMGTAVFREDKLAGFMDERSTRGLLWLQGKMVLGTVTVEVPQAKGEIGLEWVRTSVKRSARVENGRITVYVNARVEADVNEERATLDLSDPKVITLIEGAMRKAIKERIEDALTQLRELNSDAAGLGEVVHQRLPMVWNRAEKNWKKEGFKQARVVVNVEAQVRRTGLSSKPKGVPEEDLIKGGR